jgi:hypothetical protein
VAIAKCSGKTILRYQKIPLFGDAGSLPLHLTCWGAAQAEHAALNAFGPTLQLELQGAPGIDQTGADGGGQVPVHELRSEDMKYCSRYFLEIRDAVCADIKIIR